MFKKLVTTACVGALALNAFPLATTASAQWMVNGTNLIGTQALATTAAVDENTLFKFAGVSITCTGKTLQGVSPQIEAGDRASASSLVFTECSANEHCTVTKTIGTVPLHAVAALGTGTTVTATFLPKTKTIFATFKFDGEECSLLGVWPVTGKAKIIAPTGQTQSVSQEIVANVVEASGELKVSGLAAELKGAALLKLSTGLPWRFL